MEKRILGYIRAFDPDFIVGDANILPQYVKDMGRQIVAPDEIWASFYKDERDAIPNYGVGICLDCAASGGPSPAGEEAGSPFVRDTLRRG